MKNLFVLVIFFATISGQQIKAQDASDLLSDTVKRAISVEPYILGVQIGTIGAWLHTELKLAERTALRIEAGYQFILGTGNNSIYAVYLPSFRLEPRWYYFLVPEGQKNDGSFLATTFFYLPDWFLIYGNQGLTPIYSGHAVGAIPKWGIKKTYFNHLTLEAGIGIGFFGIARWDRLHFFLIFETHLRVGFTL